MRRGPRARAPVHQRSRETDAPFEDRAIRSSILWQFQRAPRAREVCRRCRAGVLSGWGARSWRTGASWRHCDAILHHRRAVRLVPRSSQNRPMPSGMWKRAPISYLLLRQSEPSRCRENGHARTGETPERAPALRGVGPDLAHTFRSARGGTADGCACGGNTSSSSRRAIPCSIEARRNGIEATCRPASSTSSRDLARPSDRSSSTTTASMELSLPDPKKSA